MFAPCKGIAYSGIREIFASGIRNPGLWNLDNSSKEAGIQLTFGIRNPSSTDKDHGFQYLESESTLRNNTESKTALDSLTWGDKVC